MTRRKGEITSAVAGAALWTGMSDIGLRCEPMEPEAPVPVCWNRISRARHEHVRRISQASGCNRNGMKGQSERDLLPMQKKQKALEDMAANEDWLDGKPGS